MEYFDRISSSEAKQVESFTLEKRLSEILNKILWIAEVEWRDYKEMVSGPIECAIRSLVKYGINDILISPLIRTITILAAAKISYASFSLDTETNFHPTNGHWLTCLSIPNNEENSDLLDKITIKLLAKHDMCINERQKYS